MKQSVSRQNGFEWKNRALHARPLRAPVPHETKRVITKLASIGKNRAALDAASLRAPVPYEIEMTFSAGNVFEGQTRMGQAQVEAQKVQNP